LDVIRGYIELGLRLGRHLDGLVDGYFGPPEITATVGDRPLPAAAELVADAAGLREALPEAGLDPGRTRWLGAQLLGLETVARRLAGEDIHFAEEVERCYGIRPQRVPEAVFEAAHRELDELLPGDGSLAERWQAWQEGDTLAPDQLEPFATGLADDLRGRTADMFGLPAGESVRFEVVRGEPWAGFNYYEGGLHSRIAINADVPLAAGRAVHLVAHETYPGHHTEHVWKEQLLVRERGQIEESLLMIGTPQALISEGIAETGWDVLLGDEVERVGAEHLARIGVSYDAELALAVNRASYPLGYAAANAAFLVHEDGATTAEAADYIERWRLVSRARAENSVRFLADPLWRSYATTYDDGERICKAWVDGDPARFRRLLTEQLTPADLL
jgi:hypothetical protein